MILDESSIFVSEHSAVYARYQFYTGEYCTLCFESGLGRLLIAII